MKVRNTFIIFIVSGFWHGANWTFVIWGLLNALFIMPSIIFNSNRNNLEIVANGKYLPSIKELFAICLTFMLTVFAWIFFRAENVSHAIKYITGIFSKSLFSVPTVKPYILFCLLMIFILIEWLGRENKYALEKFGFGLPRLIRWGFYYLLIFAIFYFAGSEQQFIYFQF